MNCTVIHKNPMNLFNVGLYHREADTKLCTCTGRGARSHASRKEKGRKKENRRESYRILPVEKNKVWTKGQEGLRTDNFEVAEMGGHTREHRL